MNRLGNLIAYSSNFAVRRRARALWAREGEGTMTQASRPNILLITCDQYRFPRFSYGAEAGFDEPLKRILGFQREDDADNPYARYFPGLLALRENAALLRNH